MLTVKVNSDTGLLGSNSEVNWLMSYIQYNYVLLDAQVMVRCCYYCYHCL